MYLWSAAGEGTGLPPVHLPARPHPRPPHPLPAQGTLSKGGGQAQYQPKPWAGVGGGPARGKSKVLL